SCMGRSAGLGNSIHACDPSAGRLRVEHLRYQRGAPLQSGYRTSTSPVERTPGVAAPARTARAANSAGDGSRPLKDRFLNILQSLARRGAARLGRESWTVRVTRPLYESSLNFLAQDAGVPWRVNG